MSPRQPASSFSTRILTILCLARSSAPSPWQASQSGDGNAHTITVSASWGVSSMSRSSGQVPDKRVGTGDVSGLQGGWRKPPFFHTPTTSTTSSITVDTTIAQQVLSSMGRRRKKHICPPAPNTYEPEQNENLKPSRLAPLLLIPRRAAVLPPQQVTSPPSDGPVRHHDISL